MAFSAWFWVEALTSEHNQYGEGLKGSNGQKAIQGGKGGSSPGSRTVLPAFLTRSLERESVVQALSALKGLVERLAEAWRAIR